MQASSCEAQTAKKMETSKPMDWKADKNYDVFFLRQLRASEIFETRKGSPERGQIWDGIAEKLNSLSYPKFHVTKRSLRDRYTLLMSKFKKKAREEEKESGTSPEPDEIDVILEELYAKQKEMEINASSTDKRKDKDKATAEDMRLKAMERMGESQKRESDSDDAPAKESRKSVGDAVEYLQEKSKMEMSLRKEELELRKQEEARGANAQNEMLKLVQAMVATQQQQSQVMMDLFAKVVSKQD